MRNIIDLLKNIDRNWLMEFLYKALLIEGLLAISLACVGFGVVPRFLAVLMCIDAIAFVFVAINRRKK